MSRYLEKIHRLRKIYQQNGGLIGCYMTWYRTDELKWGDLVGEDKYGNKYYENKTYFIGRSRWVHYPLNVNMDYDGSQVPAEWHRWLHYSTDHPPTTHPPEQHRWLSDHIENFSGTQNEYVPYSTTKPKIESWVPPKN